MRNVWGVVGLALWFHAAWAEQAVVAWDEAAVADQRARLNAQREAQTAQFAAEDDACLQRFAVTDCQNDVAKRRRAALAVFKRQETALNDAVRQQRAHEQVKRTQEKLDARAADDASKEVGVPNDRAQALQEKNRNHPQPAASDARRAKAVPVVDAKALVEKRQAYVNKQQELQRKRQERDKRLLEKGPEKSHLPLPP